MYVYVKYVGGGKTVSELERNFRLLDEVLKFQTVKVGDGIDASDVQVDAEAVKFEAVEPPGEEEQELTLEQQLGLVEGAKFPMRDRDDDMDDMDDQEDDE